MVHRVFGETDAKTTQILNYSSGISAGNAVTAENLFSSVMNQNGLSSGMLPISNFTDMIEEFSIKIWISKENNLIMKAYESMTTLMTINEYSTSTKLDVTILFSNYNTEICIELPEDAKNATSYSELFSILSPA